MRKRERKGKGKKPAGKMKQTGRKPAGMGIMKKLLLVAVIFTVAAVMALRGCPRSMGGRHGRHYSARDHFFFAKADG